MNEYLRAQRGISHGPLEPGPKEYRAALESKEYTSGRSLEIDYLHQKKKRKRKGKNQQTANEEQSETTLSIAMG